MKRWFADGVFRAVLRNAGYLGSGKLVGALLGLISLSCAGRGLTPALFGILMIIHTYATGAGALVKFQTWQFIVRYGTPALQRGDTDFARDSIRFAFGLDITSGLVGMVGAMVVLPLLASHLDIQGPTLVLALIYCTLVPTMSAATAIGVLRILDRFDLIGVQQIVTPIIRAIGAAIAFFGHLGFVGFVATWYVADLAGDLVLWGMAARELKRRGMLDAFRPGLFGVAHRLPKAWSFVWTTNIAHSIYSAWGPLSNLVVASLLGPVAAGLYKIAATLMDSTSKPADLLSRGFYPEIMRLDPASKQPWRLGLRVGALSACLGIALVLLVMVGGKPVIGFIFGRKYIAAFDLLQIMTWSLVISTAAFPLESLLYMVDRQRSALVAQTLSAILYLGLLYGLTHMLGLIGAGIAFLIGTVLTGLFMLIPTLQSYHNRARYKRHPHLDLAEI
ncbi:MAG TPA: lipopolysaccharide biosynthesis protein [Sphingomonas sp.]|uniref:lipopolysaccharide biosynthesis protein n=1 Tax=Sphingomonas sp. TaxID=28214 RepID=UPI002CB99F14|nr:lipopolysaccharide biosynthesis protein [Sphingomonas sp.]HMI21270.1 lipopolysaccharide biosynthesis protein [Sphingomonas sp.]